VTREKSKWCLIPVGDRIYYAFILLTVPSIFYSCYTSKFYLFNFCVKILQIRDFYKINAVHSEFLLWTIFVTLVQLYRYHLHTMGIYDEINIKSATSFRKMFHNSAQFAVSMVTFLSFLLLLINGFLELYKWEIFNDFKFSIFDLVHKYAPFLTLHWLLKYFLSLDILLLAININFCQTNIGSADLLCAFKKARRDAMWGIVIAILFIAVDFGITSLAMNDDSQNDVMPLVVILVLQYLYIIMDIQRRTQIE
jgi:hypothetical protein